MAQSFWEKLAKKTNKNLLADGLGSAEFDGYVDTGSYTMNMICSGSIFHGIPNNSFTGLAGDPATGKTFFALGISNNFLNQNPDAGVFYGDTESAIRKAMAEARGMDASRVTLYEPHTVEQFRTEMLEFMHHYKAAEDRPPLFCVLDSLGNLSTEAELSNATTFGDSKEAEKRRSTRDMQRPGLIKGSFRMLRTTMAKLKVPMIITNHVYTNTSGYGAPKEMGGGSGLKYAADAILFLSKAKAKEGDDSSGEVIGSKVTVTAVKSRLGRENAKVQVLLNYDTGLDRYYGLIDMALEAGVFKQLAKGLELPGGVKVSRKEILRNPEQVYTQEILQAIDEAARPTYVYGEGEQRTMPYVDPSDEVETDEE